MPEHHDMPAEGIPPDSSETRDWDLPPGARGAPGGEGVEEIAEARGGATRAPDVPPAPAGQEPPDESERRDWDLP